ALLYLVQTHQAFSVAAVAAPFEHRFVCRPLPSDIYSGNVLRAKSAMPPGAREAHRLAQKRSGYPRGARHEVQSLAMLDGQKTAVTERLKKRDSTKEPDIDLVLHLVASHHGYCRPFAPVVIDEDPVEVSLSKHASREFGTLDFSLPTSKNELHRLDSALGDRFWALIANYGWQQRCWMEAILRLADHRASEEEQAKEASP
ncbi:MAG: hypothetical protein JXA30_23100, partial [Deltaproteobacteria bacterium]|nr:hypothetical protein [Deltaproteobacteria bacterium]